MSKIVCDICGSTYSDTEAQCPICGTAKSEQVKPVVETTMEEQPKSGKYSKTENKKSGTSGNRQGEHSKSADKRKQEAPSNTAMIIIVAVLLIAIVSVCVFIAVRLMGDQGDDPIDNSSSTSSAPFVEIPCTGIVLENEDNMNLSFTKTTESVQLTVKALPENTTETVTLDYTSSDPSVAVVDKQGVVTPVATGDATITISYGTFKIEVAVSCNIPGTGPSLELSNTADITLSSSYGISYDLYKLVKNADKFDKDKFVVTCDNEELISVNGTVVTVIKDNSSTVTVKATITYGDQSVDYKFKVGTVTLSALEYELHSNKGSVGTATAWLAFEMSLDVKNDNAPNEVVLKLVGKDGTVVKDVEWTFSNDFKKCCSYSINEETGEITVTATATTENLTNGKFVFLYATYNGVKYTCKITVASAAA